MLQIYGSSTTHAQEMKQIALNLVSGVCNTLHANPGVMSPSNVIPPPIGSDSLRQRFWLSYRALR